MNQEEQDEESLWDLIRKGIAVIGAFCVIVTCGKGCDKIQEDRANEVKQRVFQWHSEGNYILETDRKVNNFHKRDEGSYKYIESIKEHRHFEAMIAIDTVKLMNQ